LQQELGSSSQKASRKCPSEVFEKILPWRRRKELVESTPAEPK
jgi:hypothetical protein